MENKNVQEFLNSLTEEQRAAVLACKTEEDLEKVVDEYDIDLPDEMLADVAGGRGGLLPALMAGIMALSGGAAVMGTTSAIQANAYVSDWTEQKDDIEDYFWSFNYNPQTFFQSFIEDSGTATKSKTIMNSDGSVSIMRMERAQDNLTYDSFGISNADSNTIYPGALLKANEGLVTGNPTPIKMQRRDLNITIPGAYMKDGKSAVITVNPANGGDVNAAISELRNNFKDNSDMPAQMTARIEKVESEQQIKAKMNFSEELWGKVKVSASTDYQTKTQAVVVDVSQVLYSVSADNVTDADLFPDTMKVERVKRYINEDEPPVVVSNVNYGKRVIACIQTDDMSFDLKAALEVEAMGGKIKGDAEMEYKEKLSKCAVRVFAMGGSSQAAGEYLTWDVAELMNAVRKNTAFDGYAVPISYTTRWAKDGTIAQSSYMGYKWEAKEVKKLTSTIPIHFEFIKDSWGEMQKGIVKFYGRRVIGVNEDGSLIRSDEELIKTITLDYSTSDDFRLPADVIADSVRIVCDAEGKNEKIENESDRSINLQDLVYKARFSSANDISVFYISIAWQPGVSAYIKSKNETTNLVALFSVKGTNGITSAVLGEVPVMCRQ